MLHSRYGDRTDVEEMAALHVAGVAHDAVQCHSAFEHASESFPRVLHRERVHMLTTPLQTQSPCRAQGRQVCSTIHRDCTRRDQAAPATHHIIHTTCATHSREPESTCIPLTHPPWSIARHLLPRPLPAQGPERDARVHGVRGARGEPAGPDQAAPEQGRADARREADREADLARAGLHAPLLRRHSHRCVRVPLFYSSCERVLFR